MVRFSGMFSSPWKEMSGWIRVHGYKLFKRKNGGVCYIYHENCCLKLLFWFFMNVEIKIKINAKLKTNAYGVFEQGCVVLFKIKTKHRGLDIDQESSS